MGKTTSRCTKIDDIIKVFRDFKVTINRCVETKVSLSIVEGIFAHGRKLMCSGLSQSLTAIRGISDITGSITYQYTLDGINYKSKLHVASLA